MSGIQQLLLGGSPAGYQIERSLRFNSADSAYLNRTPASAGNRKTWTWSGWVKRSALGTGYIFGATTDAWNVNWTLIYFTSDNTLLVQDYATSERFQLRTTQVFRDVSAWYHLVVAVDTTQATSTNRIKIYVNGSQITAFSTASYPSQNLDTFVDNNVGHQISGTGGYFNGYLTEVNFIDGQALTPSSFGQTNASTGVWEPVKYTGTYGTNGFYLNFSDNSNTTAATLGKDSSGNGNNWTPNNFSVTAGAGNDSLVDTPTPYGTDTGVGGEVRGNYATFNPLNQALPGATFANGNLDVSTSAAQNYAKPTIYPSTGKWYYEFTVTAKANSNFNNFAIYINTSADGIVAGYEQTGQFYNGSAWNGSAAYSVWAVNGVIGVALDLDAETVRFYYNGVAQGSGTISLPINASDPVAAVMYSQVSGNSMSANFGQRPFAYTAPSGFKALCTQNLPTPTIGATSTTQAGKYFDATTYTGTGSSRSVTNSGSFAPDFVWIKSRSNAYYHQLYDIQRGVQKAIYSNDTLGDTTETIGLTAFNSDGFTVSTAVGVNENTKTYVAWQWKANGAGSSNTQGTITSTVSANTTAGFSIVTYTGTGANATVGHGLGVAPSMIIVKQRNGTFTWRVYHSSLANTQVLYLSATDAATTETTAWNSTSPTSSVFSVGTGSGVNGNTNTYVAYCFAPVAGYSAFGSYTGNGSSDGPFVYTGFRPRYVLIKNTTSGSADNWMIQDTSRSPVNLAADYLVANTTGTETTYGGLDFLSNGFKIRTSSSATNASTNTYIYAAFCESPFKFSLAR